MDASLCASSLFDGRDVTASGLTPIQGPQGRNLSWLTTGIKSRLTNFDEVYRSSKSSGFCPVEKFQNYPEDYLSRLKIDTDLVEMIIARLQAEDIYANPSISLPSAP